MNGILSSMETLSATINKVDILTASLSSTNSIEARLSDLDQIKATIHDDDIYDADYDIEVGFEDTVINTKNKFLKDDIIIKKVAVSEVSNDSGGYTLCIGE